MDDMQTNPQQIYDTCSADSACFIGRHMLPKKRMAAARSNSITSILNPASRDLSASRAARDLMKPCPGGTTLELACGSARRYMMMYGFMQPPCIWSQAARYSMAES